MKRHCEVSILKLLNFSRGSKVKCCLLCIQEMPKLLENGCHFSHELVHFLKPTTIIQRGLLITEGDVWWPGEFERRPWYVVSTGRDRQ
jgi:hypothetical protein